MTTTPNLVLPFIAQGQAQKEVTHNAGLTILDALTQISVLSRVLATPPGSPADGDRYIVPAGATGAWAGMTGKVAAYQNLAWVFYTPRTGWLAFIEDERLVASYSDSAWQTRAAGTSSGGALGLLAVDEELTLSGAYVDAAGLGIIPDRAIVLGVASRTTLAITGASSYSVGVSGNTGQFGSSLGVSLGSTNIGVIGPTAFYSPTPLRVTAAGGSFSGGKVRLILYALTLTAPAS